MILPILLAMAAPADTPADASMRLAFAPVHSVMHVVLGDDGEVVSCTIDVKGTVPPDFTEGACEAFDQFGILAALLGEDRDRLGAASIVLDMGPAASSPVAPPAGERLASITAGYVVGADGMPARCAVTSRQGTGMARLDLCGMAFSSDQAFEPGRGDRRGTISLSVYGEPRTGG